MSNLSTAECTAGISRSALAALAKKNGTNGNAPRETKQPIRETISGYRETPVIDTPMRKLAILEAASGEIVLRSAEFVGNRCDLALIHLEREPARSLAVALLKIAHGGEA